MKRKTFSLLLALVLAGLCTFGVHASDADLTPLPGNPLRKQVLDALRTEVKKQTGLDVDRNSGL